MRLRQLRNKDEHYHTHTYQVDPNVPLRKVGAADWIRTHLDRTHIHEIGISAKESSSDNELGATVEQCSDSYVDRNDAFLDNRDWEFLSATSPAPGQRQTIPHTYIPGIDQNVPLLKYLVHEMRGKDTASLKHLVVELLIRV